MQLDHIDLFQLHWPDRYVPLFGQYQFDPEGVAWDPVPFEETVSAVGEEIRKGRIRHWGLCNETTYGVTMMCETAKRLGVPLPVSVQNDYSICDRCIHYLPIRGVVTCVAMLVMFLFRFLAALFSETRAATLSGYGFEPKSLCAVMIKCFRSCISSCGRPRGIAGEPPMHVRACRAFDTELAEACHAYNMKLLSYGSLNGGFLSGKYLNGAKPEGARHSENRGFQHRYTRPAVEKAVLKYKAIADKNGLSLTQLVIAWCGSHEKLFLLYFCHEEKWWRNVTLF